MRRIRWSLLVEPEGEVESDDVAEAIAHHVKEGYTSGYLDLEEE